MHRAHTKVRSSEECMLGIIVISREGLGEDFGAWGGVRLPEPTDHSPPPRSLR